MNVAFKNGELKLDLTDKKQKRINAFLASSASHKDSQLYLDINHVLPKIKYMRFEKRVELIYDIINIVRKHDS